MTLSPRSLPFIVVLGLALSGCTAQSQPTPTPIASPSPSAAAEPTPSRVDCPDILSADGNAKLAADGLLPVESRVFDPLALELADAGGVACTWVKPHTDLVLTVVQLPVPDSEWERWETALAEADFIDSSGSGTVYEGPIEPGAGINPVVVVGGDRITFVSVPAFADLLTAHAI